MGGRGRESDRYKLHEGKQGKHIKGHNNYKDDGRSTTTASKELLEKVVNEKSGTGEIHGNKEVMDFEETIGQYVDDKTGESQDTSWGTVHYSDDGWFHVVPAPPR